MNKLFTEIKDRFRTYLGTTSPSIKKNPIVWMGLTEEEHIEFNTWAFGSNIRKTLDTRMTAFEQWNERHGDLMTLKRGDSIMDSCKKMIVLWRESKTVIITDENKK